MMWIILFMNGTRDIPGECSGAQVIFFISGFFANWQHINNYKWKCGKLSFRLHLLHKEDINQKSNTCGYQYFINLKSHSGSAASFVQKQRLSYKLVDRLDYLLECKFSLHHTTAALMGRRIIWVYSSIVQHPNIPKWNRFFTKCGPFLAIHVVASLRRGTCEGFFIFK